MKSTPSRDVGARSALGETAGKPVPVAVPVMNYCIFCGKWCPSARETLFICRPCIESWVERRREAAR